MRIAGLIARYLLGLMFVVFGLNIFLNFIPQPPPPPGLAGQFVNVLMQSHYILPVGAFEIIGGLLLLSNLWVPLGLTILGPLIVNILMVHIILLPEGLPIAIITTLLWFLVFVNHRAAFAGILARKA